MGVATVGDVNETRRACRITGCGGRAGRSCLCHEHVKIATRYNLAPEFLAELLSDWACGACGSTYDSPCVDHDHACCPGGGSCGRCVRGVLCKACNVLEGRIRLQPGKYRRLLYWATEMKPLADAPLFDQTIAQGNRSQPRNREATP